MRHTLSDPYPGTPAKKILYQVAFGDHQVAPVSVEIAARSNGASIHTPVLEPGKVVPEVTPYYGIRRFPRTPSTAPPSSSGTAATRRRRSATSSRR